MNQLELQLNELETGIIKTLLYSGVFDYPLTEEELMHHCQARIADKSQFQSTIESLVSKKLIFHIDGFFQLKEDDGLVRKRLQANSLSDRFMPIAHRFSRILFRFPYVRGVCLSGSISKKNLSAGNDIDYFIIAESKRIWLLWFFIILFRRTLGHKRNYFFCVNYLIEKDTVISPMNIFTASELTTLIPTCGKKTYLELLNQNEWTKQYYPNIQFNNEINTQDEQPQRLKYFIEFICNNRIVDFMEYAVMKLFIRRMEWQIATNRRIVENKESFFNTVNCKTIRINYVNNNQSKILNRLYLAIKEFEKTKHLKLFDSNE